MSYEYYLDKVVIVINYMDHACFTNPPSIPVLLTIA